jgi:hypothetical protein
MVTFMMVEVFVMPQKVSRKGAKPQRLVFVPQYSRLLIFLCAFTEYSASAQLSGVPQTDAIRNSRRRHETHQMK